MCHQIWNTQQWPQDWKMWVSFQSQRRAMPKNTQTTIQLPSFHMLAILCSKSFKLGFCSLWTEKFQMYKLVWRGIGPEIKLPVFVRSWRRQGSSRKISTASLTMLKLLTVWITNWKILKEMGIWDHLTCHLKNLCAGQEATVGTGHGTTDRFKIGKGVLKAVYCHPAYLTYMQSTSWETWGWMSHKLESRSQGEISATSDMQMIPL